MSIDWINMSLAFIEGIALIASPCILPILPIILSGSLTGKKTRPLGIIMGFIATFTLVTLFAHTLVELAQINPDILRNTSFAILILLGIVMCSSYLTDKFNFMTQRLTRVGSTLQTVNNTQGGFLGGLLFGGLVGVIWTPCAGPILAAVIVQVIIQQTTLNSFLIVTTFAIGAALPMLLIALLGREFINKFRFLRENTVWLRKLLGVIIIASVFLLIFNANYFTSTTVAMRTHATNSLVNGLEHPYKAPEIAGIDAWINSSPLKINELKGKVVLIDFWTYSCINCIRTLPYLKDWYDKYHDQGLEIIGVHSPEFAFERNIDNVKNAVLKDGIHYPVALDNGFATWQNFHNEYWPAHFLINKDGEVVYEHFGEGEYDVTENNIRYLLGLNNLVTNIDNDEKYSSQQTPETYLGYERANQFVDTATIVKDRIANYQYLEPLAKNTWSLQGDWIIYPDKIVASSAGASIKLHFNAGKVYAVMGSPTKAIDVLVLLNGEAVEDKNSTDLLHGQVTVKQQRLYTLLDLSDDEDAILELSATEPGLEIYTFTFGS